MLSTFENPWHLGSQEFCGESKLCKEKSISPWLCVSCEAFALPSDILSWSDANRCNRHWRSSKHNCIAERSMQFSGKVRITTSFALSERRYKRTWQQSGMVLTKGSFSKAFTKRLWIHELSRRLEVSFSKDDKSVVEVFHWFTVFFTPCIASPSTCQTRTPNGRACNKGAMSSVALEPLEYKQTCDKGDTRKEN